MRTSSVREGRGAGGRGSVEGDALLVARTRLGLTQPAFAARLAEVLGRNVERTQIAKWEAGVYRPRAAVMLAAAALVDLPLHELMREGAAVRGPVAAAGQAQGRSPGPAPAPADPRAQLRALLDLGFSLDESIELVQRHGSGAPFP